MANDNKRSGRRIYLERRRKIMKERGSKKRRMKTKRTSRNIIFILCKKLWHMRQVRKDLRNHHDLPPRLFYVVTPMRDSLFFFACNIFKNKRKFSQVQNVTH